MMDWFVVMGLIEPWIEEDWPDAFFEPYVSAEVMPMFVFPTMVFFTLFAGFAVYTRSFAIPLVFSLIFGPATGLWIAGAPLSIIVVVQIVIVALLGAGLYWRISRG